MAEETTTEASVESGGSVINGVPVDDQGQAIPVPEENEEQAAAVQDTVTETAEDKSDEGAEALPEHDKKLASFAKGQGIEDVSTLTPRELSLLKSAYDSKVEFTQKRQAESEIEKTMTGMSDASAQQQAEATGENPEVLKRLQRMEVRDSVRDFFDKNPEARQYEQSMAKIAVESGLYGTPEAILKASYAIALSGNMDAVKSQGGREALGKLAHKQNAAVPTGNAVNGAITSSSEITPQNVDRLVGQNDLAWFEKNREAINRAMAG